MAGLSQRERRGSEHSLSLWERAGVRVRRGRKHSLSLWERAGVRVPVA
jgi:hypothetical protein